MEANTACFEPSQVLFFLQRELAKLKIGRHNIQTRFFRESHMTSIIGIDLGTTNSVAAFMGPDGPTLIPNALREVLTPSVVGFDDDGKLLVGRPAKEWQVLHPERCASVFKRRMGIDEPLIVAGREITAEELSSLVLRSLKQDAEAHFGHPVEQAVITVPAYFNDQQRKATLNAGRIAGFKVERIFNEPTAAALAYGFHEAKENKVLLIFDLGGGTFDVSIVEIFEGSLEVRSSCGESLLGGEDFTRALAARVLDSHGMSFERAEMDSPLLVSRLIQLCERAKCLLTKQPETVVRSPNKKGELSDDGANLTVKREQFQAWTRHILARVELPIRRVLGDAGLKKQDVNEIILVGGATRMPAVIDFVTDFFGMRPQCRINPDEVVGLGAAVQAGLIGRNDNVEDLVVTDVSPFTLGIDIVKQFGGDMRTGYFLPIIGRNTTIPVSRVETISTVAPNQTELVIKVYQGESRRVDGNLFLGEFRVTGIPRGPAGQPVDIRFTYDLNGVLEVEAVVLETRQKFTHIITKHAKGLTPDQVRRAVDDMKALKTHPREETVNRFLLRRAERVYQELSPIERDRLSQMLDGYEEALESRDSDAIQKFRAVLESYLNEFDPEADDSWGENKSESE
jgi:molecular chaperone HscC